jgi:tetratricopeptide (TPR) repeat protein
MRRSALSLVAVICFSVIALESRATAKEQWTRVRSENFTLIGNASGRQIRDVAVKLEQYRTILERVFGAKKISHTVPTTVIVFKNEKSFNPFRPLYQGRLTDVAGYFQPGRDINYIAVSAEQKGPNAFGTIFHELVHLFVDNNFSGMPLCLNEGLAEYYNSVKISDDGKKISLGSVTPHRERLLRANKRLPLRTLLATDSNSDYYNEGDQRSVFYAQSWELVHYLLHRDENNGLEQFARLLRRLSEGATLDDGLKEVFHSNIDEIEFALQTYLQTFPFPSTDVTFEQRLAVSKSMPSSLITVAEARAHVGDLLLHLNRVEESETYLQEAIALDPNLVAARASLGMLRVKQNRIAEAIDVLRRAATIDRQNYLTQYYFAYALSRDGATEDESVRGYNDSSVAEMRSALDRATELSPNFIEAYRLHAFVNLVRDERLDKAEELLQRGLGLSPGRQDLMLILAQVHLRMLNFKAARAVLEPIMLRPTDAKFRDQAKGFLEDISYAETQASRPVIVARKWETPLPEQSSLTGSSLQQKAHAPKPWLAKRFTGERVRGTLTNIECLEKGVALSVKVGSRTLRLHASELRSVFFVTYVPGLERTVTCGTRGQNLVVLTYRSTVESRSRFDGEAIAIEFVPEDIDIEP